MNEFLRNGLMRRNSNRFSRIQIKDDELQDIIEAGKLFKSMLNEERSWHFTVIQKKTILEEVNLLCHQFYFQHAGIKTEAMYSDDNLNFLFNAPTLVIISGDCDDEAVQNAAHATFGNMMLLAEKMGIGSCWNYSIKLMFDSADGSEFAKRLGIPKGYTPLSVGVFGYREQPVFSNLVDNDDVQFIK